MSGERPLIGVTPLYDRAKESLWMLPGYFDRVREAGGIPFMLPLADDAAEETVRVFDGFLFTGGQDVDPALYGSGEPRRAEEICPERDAAETALLRAALREGKPVLGICRGLQFINVFFGGSLWEDLGLRGSSCRHRQDRPYTRGSHDVVLKKASPLAQCLKADRITVNSCHHQGIRDLAPGLEIMAEAEDGLIEAVCHPEHRFVWAVQWHPEMMAAEDVPSRRIFRAFTAACAGG